MLADVGFGKRDLVKANPNIGKIAGLGSQTAVISHFVSNKTLQVLGGAVQAAPIELLCFDEITLTAPTLTILEMRKEFVDSDSFRHFLRRFETVPIIGITDWSELSTGKARFDIRVDELVFMPMQPSELAYRINRYTQRDSILDLSSTKLIFGDFTFDIQNLSVEFDHKRLRLTKREFELLLFLARKNERLVNHDELALEVLHLAPSADSYVNTINVHLARLRSKLREVNCGERLTTVRNQGFGLTINGPELK